MSLYSIAQEVLESAAESLVDAPKRQYVTVGDASQTAWDTCEQLTVTVTGIYPGLTVGNQQAGTIGCAVQPVAKMCIELVRCIPGLTSSGPPTTESLISSGQDMAIDMDDLFCGIADKAMSGTLISDPDKHSVKLLSVDAIGPSGGMVGMRLCLEIRSPCGSIGS